MDKRILVVDDNKSILTIIKHWLTGAGYEVAVTEHPRLGLNMSRWEEYDLIILDVMMEEMNGLEVLECLRAEEATREVPVMIITAASLFRSISSETKEMFDDFLAKPFHKDDLLEKVEQALFSRKAVVG